VIKTGKQIGKPLKVQQVESDQNGKERHQNGKPWKVGKDGKSSKVHNIHTA
jgi:hypothetical protein